jgi:2-keto-4-pentenoate hydratase/2-oxohepta-3-ene-1,7-dioic acid hydratase in catechol pathway
MKIICIGRNYADHAKELNNAVPYSPVIFMKPDTALIKDGQPFYLPDFSNDVHHEIELVLKVGKMGKHIEEKFAHKYYEEIGLGIDFTARDLQNELKQKGLPWEKAKAFDGSAIIGSFVNKTTLGDHSNISFSLNKNGTQVQQGNTQDLLFGFDYLVSYISSFFTLKVGDLIYTGTPAGVGKVEAGDQLEGYIGEAHLLSCEVK